MLGRITLRVQRDGRSSTGKFAAYADSENGATNRTRYEYTGCGCILGKITTPGGRITVIDYYPTGDPNAGKVKTITRVPCTRTDTSGRSCQRPDMAPLVG